MNDSEKTFTRESLLRANGEMIEALQKRVSMKRFKAMEADGLKLAHYRVLIQALQLQNSILKDSEIESIARRLEALECAQKRTQPGEEPVYIPVFEGDLV